MQLGSDTALVGAVPAGVPAISRANAGRIAAGRQLAELLLPRRDAHAIVLALPPGGVVIAGEVARVLRLPLDVLVSRTFVAPPHDTLAGAFCERGGLCLNQAAWRFPGVTLDAVWAAARQARQEVMLLAALYRGERPLPIWRRRQVLLVDDGLGSGLAQLAALQVLRRYHPHSCIVVTPWATSAALQRVASHADVLVALTCGERTQAERHWGSELSDDAAAALLEAYRQHEAPDRLQRQREEVFT